MRQIFPLEGQYEPYPGPSEALEQGPYAVLLNKNRPNSQGRTAAPPPLGMEEYDPQPGNLPESHKIIRITLKSVQYVLKHRIHMRGKRTVTALFKFVFSETFLNSSYWKRKLIRHKPQ